MNLLADAPNWLADVPLTSSQLMILGALLLFLAGLLLGLRRTTKVELQRSNLTDELIVYLGRIADALERNAPRTPDQIIGEIQNRIGERLKTGQFSKVQSIPNTLSRRDLKDDK